MKNYLFGITLGLVLTVAPQRVGAQGTVSFANAVIYTNDYRTQAHGIMSPASAYTFGLYLGTTAAAAQASTTPAFVITPAANAFAGTISSATQTIVGHSTGETLFFVIKGWDGGASSFEAALASGTASIGGISGVGYITTGLGGGTAPPFFLFTGPGGIGSTGFVFAFVPEPSAFALGGFCLAALAFRKRRK